MRRNQCSSTLIDEELSLDADAQRTEIIRNLFLTEAIYQENLMNFVEIYSKAMRSRRDLFNEKHIDCLMRNIEEISRFHRSFFDCLTNAIDPLETHRTLIGRCFLLYVRTTFDIFILLIMCSLTFFRKINFNSIRITLLIILCYCFNMKNS